MNAASRPSKRAFTLLELLVALAILVTAFTIVWGTFSGTVNAWRRGSAFLDDLHHGDFVMEQLVSALRSAAFFSTAPSKYGFRLDDRGSGPGARDRFSWVCSGTAFIPPGSPLAQGLHRIVVSVEPDDEGHSSFTVRAYPHLADEERMAEPEPWYISAAVRGLDCRIYNLEDEVWEDRWEDTNALPSVVEVTLYMEPIQEYGEPVEIRRLVEIPVAPVVTQAVKWAAEGRGARGKALQAGAGAGGPSGQREAEVKVEAEK